MKISPKDQMPKGPKWRRRSQFIAQDFNTNSASARVFGRPKPPRPDPRRGLGHTAAIHTASKSGIDSPSSVTRPYPRARGSANRSATRGAQGDAARRLPSTCAMPMHTHNASCGRPCEDRTFGGKTGPPAERFGPPARRFGLPEFCRWDL